MSAVATLALTPAFGLIAALRQHHNLSADALSNCLQFTTADMGFEKFEVAALNADNGKAGPAGQLTDMMTLANKDFSHFLLLLF
jgi:hypothetical protein